MLIRGELGGTFNSDNLPSVMVTNTPLSYVPNVIYCLRGIWWPSKVPEELSGN